MNTQQLEDARRSLLARYPNYAPILVYFKGRFVAVPGKGTITVDRGMRVYFDPDLKWKQVNIESALLHELGHICRNHHSRAEQYARARPDGQVNWHDWNIAGDLEINDDLPDDLPLPEGYGVYPHNYGMKDGGIAEVYYNKVHSMRPDPPPPTEPPPEPSPDDEGHGPDWGEQPGREQEGEGQGEQPDGGQEEGPRSEEDEQDSQEGPSTDDHSGDTPEPSEEGRDDQPTEHGEPGSQDDCPDDADSGGEPSPQGEGGDQGPAPSPPDAQEPSPGPSEPGRSPSSSDDGSDSADGQDGGGDGSGEGRTPDSTGSGDPGRGDDHSQDTSADPQQEPSTSQTEGTVGPDEGEEEDDSPETVEAHEGDCGSCAGGPARDDELPMDDDQFPGVTEEQIRRAVDQAKRETGEEMAKPQDHSQGGSGIGDMTGVATAVFGDAISEVYDKTWEAVMHREIAKYLKTGGSGYQRPSRRLYDRKVIHVGTTKVPPNVAFVVDVSGSINDQAAKRAFGIINKFKGWNMRFRIAACDTKAVEVRPGQAIYTGGGTDLGEGLEYVKKHFGKVDVCFVITDGCTPWPDEKYPFPVVVMTWMYDGPDWSTTLPMPPLNEEQAQKSGGYGYRGQRSGGFRRVMRRRVR